MERGYDGIKPAKQPNPIGNGHEEFREKRFAMMDDLHG